METILFFLQDWLVIKPKGNPLVWSLDTITSGNLNFSVFSPKLVFPLRLPYISFIACSENIYIHLQNDSRS